MTLADPATSHDDSRPQVRVSAIIVTYRSRAHIGPVLESLDRSLDRPGISGEVIVVDNASMDGTVEWLRDHRPDIHLIVAPSNEGFGRACNRAFEVATGDVWLLLNPDARLEADTVAVLVDELDRRPEVAAIGPTLAAPHEAESAGMLPSAASGAGHFLFLNRLGRRGRGPWRGFQLARQPVNTVVDVEWVGAAVVALRPVAVRTVGGFDPDFFLYGEDIELCARLRSAGWQLKLTTKTRASHEIAASSDPRSTRWLDGVDQGMSRIGRGRADRFGFFAAAAVGLAVRAAVATIRGRDDRRAGRLLPSARRAAALALESLARGRS